MSFGLVPGSTVHKRNVQLNSSSGELHQVFKDQLSQFVGSESPAALVTPILANSNDDATTFLMKDQHVLIYGLLGMGKRLFECLLPISHCAGCLSSVRAESGLRSVH